MERETVLQRDRASSAEGRSQTPSAALGQTMKIRVLGCSGGIGGGLRTTSFLVDEDVLIDAGTGLGDRSLENLAKIDHIFVHYPELAHVSSSPCLGATV